MPSYDFIYDLLEKLESQGFEYILTYNLADEDNDDVECTMQSNMESGEILKILEGMKTEIEEKTKIEEENKPKRKKKNGKKKPPRKGKEGK